jgi:hypothetical protein
LLLLQNTTNVIVIASNNNPKFAREDPDPTLVKFGSYALWQSYHNASSTHTLLETRLDADDGLANVFMGQIQQHVHQSLPSRSRRGGGGGGGVRVYCIDAHLEWQQQPSHHYNNNNNSNKKSNADDVGLLMGMRTLHCVTPGLTFVYPAAADDRNKKDILLKQLPATKHHLIHNQLPKCRRNKQHGDDDDDDLDDDEGHDLEPCWVRFAYQDFPLALRARTITSAGMDRVLDQQQQLLPLLNDSHNTAAASRWNSMQVQELAWHTLLPDLFGVQQDQVRSVKQYLEAEANQAAILQQALEGQCTTGHSCKEGSRAALLSLLRRDKKEATASASAT